MHIWHIYIYRCNLLYIHVQMTFLHISYSIFDYHGVFGSAIRHTSTTQQPSYVFSWPTIHHVHVHVGIYMYLIVCTCTNDSSLFWYFRDTYRMHWAITCSVLLDFYMWSSKLHVSWLGHSAVNRHKVLHNRVVVYTCTWTWTGYIQSIA